MSKDTDSGPNLDEFGVIGRPPSQLHDLPLKFRWEATRRNPYYIVFWEDARKYRQGDVGNYAQALLRYASVLILGSIGVTSAPVDPATPFDELGADSVDPAFLSGAIQPQSLRSLAVLLLNALPGAELAVLGSIFQTAGIEYSRPDDGPRDAKHRALDKLLKMPSSHLDSYPDAPLVFIHTNASQRNIQDAVERLVQKWKQRDGIAERRVHTKKLPVYLKVWDLREGWVDGRYDREHEHQLTEIAEKLKIPLSTVVSHYRSAFQMIIGHEFSPELWVRVVAPLKTSEPLVDAEEILSAPMRRRLKSPMQKPVTDTAVGGSSNNDYSIVENESSINDDQAYVDLVLDIEGLHEKGKSIQEISEQLECAIEAVEYCLRNIQELRGI